MLRNLLSNTTVQNTFSKESAQTDAIAVATDLAADWALAVEHGSSVKKLFMALFTCTCWIDTAWQANQDSDTCGTKRHKANTYKLIMPSNHLLHHKKLVLLPGRILVQKTPVQSSPIHCMKLLHTHSDLKSHHWNNAKLSAACSNTIPFPIPKNKTATTIHMHIHAHRCHTSDPPPPPSNHPQLPLTPWPIHQHPACTPQTP